MSYRSNDCRIYVGNLPADIRSRDIEDLFYKFGKITFIDLKSRREPPFAFIDFENSRDAEDAVHARDGYDFYGNRLRVEFPRRTARERRSRTGRPRGPPTRRSENRCSVSGLPSSGSWQDLKDHLNKAGEICYADVFRDGTGVVEFLRHEDMKYAIEKFDDSKFRSREGECTYIRVKEDFGRRDDGSYSRSRSRSPLKREQESKTRDSPVNSRSRTKSRSRSHS